MDWGPSVRTLYHGFYEHRMILILAKYSAILEETKRASGVSEIGIALVGPQVTTAVLSWTRTIE